MSYKLSDEEKLRISKNRDYINAKRLYDSYQKYKDVEVGEVYNVLKIAFNRPVCHYGKDPTRFYIVSKDDGFIFAKRVTNNGKLGKDVVCMTTQYPIDYYILKPDSSYVDSILLGTNFDPTSEGKILAKKKNKARNKNKKLILNFNTTDKAYQFIQSLEVGDIIYDSYTMYGEGIVEWTITEKNINPVCQEFAKPKFSWETAHKNRGLTINDREHNRYNLPEKIELKIKPRVLTGTRHTYEKEIIFTDFYNSNRWFKIKPFSTDDFDV